MPAKNYAYVNKDMLLWARSETPFTTTADAAAYISGISADKLDAWESGAELPSITEAKKIAAAYKVPFACFYLSTPPEKKVKKYTDRRTMNGTVYCEASYELWGEINRITAIRDELLEYASDEDFVSFPLPTFEADIAITEIGKTLRDFLNLKLPFKNKSIYGNAFNYFRSIFEHRGILIAQVSGVSLSEMKGLSLYCEPCSIIAVNNKDYERAKVFSLFHELAHLVRRSSSLCLIDFDERNDGEEKLCDRIAAETLLPEDAFKQVAKSIWPSYREWSSLCLQAIGDKFGVSSVVVLRRLYELKMLPYKDYQQIYNALNEEFEANRELIERARKGKELPIKYYIRYLNKQGYLFPRIIVEAHARGTISYGEMCKTLNVGRKHIGSIEQAVMFT